MVAFQIDGLGDAGVDVIATIGNTLEVVVTCRGIRSSLHVEHAHTQLHWACLEKGGAWKAPAVQPANSRAIDAVASRISLDECNSARISFALDTAPTGIVFVLFVEAQGQERWLKSAGGQDFVVDIAELAKKCVVPTAPCAVAGTGPSGGGYRPDNPVRVAERPAEWPALAEAKKASSVAIGTDKVSGKRKGAKAKGTKAFAITQGSAAIGGNLGTVAWHIVPDPTNTSVFVEVSLPLTEDAVVSLHWGCQESAGAEWGLPAAQLANTVPFGDGKASRTALEGQARAELIFPTATAPAGMAMVLFAAVPGGGEQWLGASGGDFLIPVTGCSEESSDASPDDSIAKKFCESETKYSHWSQFQRICLANEIFSQATGVTKAEAAWLACDLRLAQGKALEWYRNRGYQPKDMAHAQEALGGSLANAFCKAGSTAVRVLLRLCVPAVPRGNSSGGDAVRHGILNIMRTHGIKEGHRPGIECKFIEQWHQKLHTNSAPDDIVICEGYLAFLSSGNPDDMWRTMEKGKITRDDLAKMCTSGFVDHTKSGAKGLNVTPKHLPQLYNDMNGYLGLLKHIHGGTDLFSLCEGCKGQYPDQAAESMAFEIFNRRDDPLCMKQIVELRRRLEPCLGKRDVLMLDEAMEAQLRSLAERTQISAVARDDLVGYLSTVLDDLRLSRRDESLNMGIDLFYRLVGKDHGGAERWSVEWCKLVHAACDRIALICAKTIDEVAGLLQGCADKLYAAGQKPGAVFAPAEKALATFGEETARCLSERLVAQALKVFMPQLRRGAGLGPWEIVSKGRGGQALGTVEVMSTLPVALDAGRAPVIAVVEQMTGWEDIPAGVVAVILPAAQAVDVLSHVAIRARNQEVLLASCDEDVLLETLRGAAASQLRLEVGPSGDVTWAAVEAGEAAAAAKAAGAKNGGPILVKVQKPPAPPAMALASATFIQHRKCLGGKSLHLAELKPKSGEYKVPTSVTVPFGIFEQVLAASTNEELRDELEELIEEGDLAKVRKFLVDELEVPEALEAALAKQLAAAGAPPLTSKGSAEWQRALKGVWASKWTDRAVSSRKQTGIDDGSLFLAVLVQPLVPASYAFVIHTKCPLPGAGSDKQLIELCVGLGESLVSNSPGRALSASVGPAGQPIVVHTYPSKPDGVFAPANGSYIFRSDSNGEDLEGFAGAGLYDSVTVEECVHRPVAYADEPLIFNAAFREGLLRKLFDLGRLVEGNFQGKPQDIEGAVNADGSLVVTQSRPQV